MTEYSIYTIYKGGMPYYGSTYSSLEECREVLYNILDYNKKHRKLYYVDNDFYKNEIPYFTSDVIYYSIHYREVSEWNKYSSEEDNNYSIKNNVINFPNCIDRK